MLQSGVYCSDVLMVFGTNWKRSDQQGFTAFKVNTQFDNLLTLFDHFIGKSYPQVGLEMSHKSIQLT